MKSKIFSAIFLIGVCYCGIANSFITLDKDEITPRGGFGKDERPDKRDTHLPLDKDEKRDASDPANMNHNHSPRISQPQVAI